MANTTEEKAKSYMYSKKAIREAITLAFGEDTAKTVTVEDVLKVFESNSSGSVGQTTLVFKDGEVVGRRCSYFGKFMYIEEFGKRGDTYAFQSKTAESLVRKARTEAIKAKSVADEQLADEQIGVADWKQKLAEIEASKEVKVMIDAVDQAPTHFDSAEDLIASL